MTFDQWSTTNDHPPVGPAIAVPRRGTRLVDEVATKVRDAILAGRLATGAELRLVTLAESIGVSTTPVREALRLLQSEGIVRGGAHHTFQVNELSLDNIRDYHLIHAEISAELAVRAASTMRPEDFDRLTRLDEAIKEAVRSGENDRMHALNFAFHKAINVSVPRSPLHEFLRVTSRYVSRRTYPDVPGWREGADEHGPIIEAMRTNDPESIRSHLMHHVIHGGESLIADLEHARAANRIPSM